MKLQQMKNGQHIITLPNDIVKGLRQKEKRISKKEQRTVFTITQ